jgi:hypothetical protein
MGIVLVARSAAPASGAAHATMRSTLRRTRSADVLALDPAEIAQTLPKRIIHVRRWTIAEHADSPDFRGLLRLAGERRKYQAESANDRRMGTSVEDGWRGV